MVLPWLWRVAIPNGCEASLMPRWQRIYTWIVIKQKEEMGLASPPLIRFSDYLLTGNNLLYGYASLSNVLYEAQIPL